MSTRWSSGWAVAILAGLMAAEPAAALPDPPGTGAGRTFLTGDGSLYYQHGTTMLGPLAVFVVLFKALVDDDEEGGDSVDWDASSCCCDPCCGWYRGHFPLEAYQLGSSAGVFVADGLTLGLRLVAQGNDEGDPVRRFWGAGPEVGWYPGNPLYPLRPFLAVGTLYTRGQVQARPWIRTVAGPAWQVRGGLNWFGSIGGLYVQTSYQTVPRDWRTGLRVSRARWGAGMGLIFFLR